MFCRDCTSSRTVRPKHSMFEETQQRTAIAVINHPPSFTHLQPRNLAAAAAAAVVAAFFLLASRTQENMGTIFLRWSAATASRAVLVLFLGLATVESATITVEPGGDTIQARSCAYHIIRGLTISCFRATVSACDATTTTGSCATKRFLLGGSFCRHCFHCCILYNSDSSTTSSDVGSSWTSP